MWNGTPFTVESGARTPDNHISRPALNQATEASNRLLEEATLPSSFLPPFSMAVNSERS